MSKKFDIEAYRRSRLDALASAEAEVMAANVPAAQKVEALDSMASLRSISTYDGTADEWMHRTMAEGGKAYDVLTGLIQQFRNNLLVFATHTSQNDEDKKRIYTMLVQKFLAESIGDAASIGCLDGVAEKEEDNRLSFGFSAGGKRALN